MADRGEFRAPELGRCLSAFSVAGFALSMFLMGAFLLALSPILPDVAGDLSARPEVLGYPGGTYSLVLGIASVVLAPLQDAVERRWLLWSGMLAHLSGLLTVATAPSWSLLVLGHGLCGLGGGIFMPAAYAVVADRSAESVRAKVLGRIGVGWAGSTLLGVPIAGALSDAFGWRGMVLVMAALWVVIALLIRGALLAAPSATSGRPAWSRVWGRAAVADLSDGGLPWVLLSTVLIFIGFYGVYTYLGLAVREALALGGAGAGGLVFCYGLGFLVGTLNSRHIDRIGSERALWLAAGVLVVVLVAMPHAVRSLSLLSMTLFVWGLFQNGAFNALTTTVSKARAALRGRALALNTACVFVGASVGTFAMGLVNARFGYPSVGLVCGLSSLGAAMVVRAKVVPCAKR